jgi:PAS domain S-box-containing protein
MKRSLDIALRYGVAALAVGAALGLKLLFDPLITEQSPFLLLAGAVVVGAWFGGLGPGLLATVLGGLGADYFFLPPEGSFTGPAVAFWPLLLFTLQGLLISSLVAALRFARKRAEQSALETRAHQERLRESEERFRLMVEGVKDYAFFMLDPGGRVTTWNEGAERVEGYRAEEILGRHFSTFYTDEEVAGGRSEEVLRAALAEGRYVEEGPRVRKDGSTFWASVLITALVDKDRNLRGFSKVVQDITERRHTDDVLRFLAESGATLASSLDYRTTLANAARLAVPTLADWCAVDVLEEDGTVERVAVEHPDPEKVALAYELQERYPPDPETTRGLPKVLKTGEPDMMAEIPEELLDEYAVDPEHRAIMRELGLRSYMVVPMVARGRRHGAITLVSEDSGRFGQTDLRLAEELARRAALAVDNAKHYEEAQREISERKETEIRLKEAEARFRTLVEHIPAMTYMEAADNEGRGTTFLYMSPQIEAVLGYSPEEWMADPGLFARILHADDRERVLAEDARTSRTGEPFRMEYRHLARDGSIVWVRDEAVLVRDHEGKPLYWLGVQFDITDRRVTEEALRQSEGRYRTVVKQAAEGIFVVDIDTKLILEANAAYRDLLGYSAQDMLGLGLTLYDVVAHDRKSVDQYIRRILDERVHFIGERRHRRKDGSLVDVEVSSSVISYGGGEALCVVVHDITERKRSAERLQRSLDALLGLYEAGQILSSSLKREEIGSRLLEIACRVSNLTAAVISIPDEEGELRIWRSTGLEELWRRARFSPEALAARQKAQETRRHQTVRLRRPEDEDGSHLVSLNLPLLVRGRLIGLLETYGPEALTERQNEETLISLANQAASALENARLYAELAERENQLQDLIRKLITAQEEERRKVSYEVHDGLAQTAAAAHQLLQAFARQHPPDSDKGRADLDRVLNLVQQTVGEARYVIADLRPTALDDLGLGPAIRLQVEKIRDEGSKVDFEEALGDERLPAEVETALFRVAQEALTNVHKHAPSARVKISLQRLNDSVRLQVRDWGPGFDPEKPANGGGPGERLGLSSMRERVALLGGHLEIHSRPGEGTEVVAEIPSVEIDGKGR